MKLYSRAWLHAARRAVAREVRARPELRREARSRIWKRHRALPLWAVRAAISIGFGMLGLRAGDPHTALGAFILWALVPMLMRAQDLQNRLVKHADAAVFVTLPVSDDWLFRYHSAHVWRASLWLGADALALYAALAWRTAAAPAMSVAYLGAAGAQGLAALGLAVLLFRVWPRVSFGGLALLWGFALCAGCLYGKAPELFRRLFAAAVTTLAPTTPAGWIHSALGAFQGNGKGLIGALPVIALIAALPWNWRALRARYRFRDDAPDWAPPSAEEDEDAPDSEMATAQMHSESAAAAIEAVESGEWLRGGFAARDGMIDHLRQRWLSERERCAFDFLRAGATGWSAAWRRAWITAATCAAALAVARLFWPVSSLGIIFGVGAWVVAGTAAPIWGGLWAGFSLFWIGQRSSAICSAMPLGYAELARVVLKANTVRLAAALPIYVAFGAFGGWFFSAAPGAGALIGCKVALLVMALQPLTTIIPFSQGTNDTSGGCLVLIAWVAAIAVFLPLIGGASVFIIASPLHGFFGVPALAGVAWIGGRIYRVAYERAWFDLLTPNR